MNLLKRFVRDEAGMETVEWAVMAALVVLGAVLVVGTLGGHVKDKFTDLDNSIAPAAPAGG